ncbi:hypothetical protein ACS0TY_017141 [Phlomoides rotata]
MAQTRDFFAVLGLLSIWFLVQKGHAFEFKVGGSKGWTLPSDPNAAIYNPWAENNRFQIGDTLLFVYPADQDSVLHVSKDDYSNCKTDSPLDKFTDGHSVYEFKQSGPHYFISGVAEHCHKNEKLVVVVMADRSNHSSNGTAAAPPPEAVSPPSPAPAGESPPSPAPSDDSSPPSPGSEAPSDESSHPKSGARSLVANLVGIVVILVGSSLAFVI